MSEYFVAGGIYQDHKGTEKFALIGPNLTDAPYLMVDGLRRYFGPLSRQGHLYRVEGDLTLSLVAPSHKALEWGGKSPRKGGSRARGPGSPTRPHSLILIQPPSPRALP